MEWSEDDLTLRQWVDEGFERFSKYLENHLVFARLFPEQSEDTSPFSSSSQPPSTMPEREG